MKKEHKHWTIKDLIEKIGVIEFPEFQREPSVWGLEKKQRLIDSILRDFDISLIYLYEKQKGYDCIDGRQRINAITSYLGRNKLDDDNEFHLKMENEIYDDAGRFKDANNKRYHSLPLRWRTKIEDFKLNIVIISDVSYEEELNLLFLRLQLGMVLNAGEKLHAMTGDMRDFIFNDLKDHAYFKGIDVPKRRYAKEQVAAQIVLNLYSKRQKDSFHRSRYIDLQDFFKEKANFSPEDKTLIKEIKEVLNKIVSGFAARLSSISNRAIAVSVFLFVNELVDSKHEKKIASFKEFFVEFLKTLKWQVAKGVQMDEAYWDLLTFQTAVTQAAGERYSIQKRHDFWREYFYFYEKEEAIKGDKEYKKKVGKDPKKERANVSL